jgi:hypothetical protein
MRIRSLLSAMILSVVASYPAISAPAPVRPSPVVTMAAASTPSLSATSRGHVIRPILVNDMMEGGSARPRTYYYYQPVYPRPHHTRRHYNAPSRPQDDEEDRPTAARPNQMPQDDEEDRPTTARPNQMPQDDEEDRPTAARPNQMPQDDEEDRPTASRQTGRMPQDNEAHRQTTSRPADRFHPDIIEEGVVPGTEGICAKQQEARAEIRLRALAVQSSLEMLRHYAQALDDAKNAHNLAGYLTMGVVDAPAIMAGWPVGPAMLQMKAFVERTLTHFLSDPELEDLLESRDTKWRTPIHRAINYLFGSTDEAVESAGVHGGAHGLKYKYEKLEEELEKKFGKHAIHSISQSLEIILFIASEHERQEKQEAMSEIIREVREKILDQEKEQHELVEIYKDARVALELCSDRASKHLPPDPYENNWVEVRNYLVDHGGYPLKPRSATSSDEEEDD